MREGVGADAVRVRREHSFTPDALALIAQLDAELLARYPEEGARHFRLSPDEIAAGRGVLLVVELAGEAVACGALRLIDGRTAEIKRMFVRSSARGRGIAARLLRELLGEAGLLQATRVVLETGARLHEAMRMYEGAGFSPIPAYGDYIDSPLSVCMAKDIVPAR
ncbi:MAG: GNAT family N-acetyltransferase [Planctomycetes bacterium]|nr:GNAT family N-acetyltransferase [Planctomycetota bacterium]